MHPAGLFEVLAHTLVLSIQAYALEAGGTPGIFVAATGAILFHAACAYGFTVNEKYPAAISSVRARFGLHPETIGRISPFLEALYLIPFAILHNSTAFGYASTAAVLAGLGFTIVWFPFGYYIGYHDKSGMIRTSVACGLLILGFTGLRAVGLESRFTRPYVAPVSVLGGIGHYLALLIQSSFWGHSSKSYVTANVIMLASLTTGAALGSVLGMSGLVNTTITFGSLWLVDKVAETRVFRQNWIITAFGGSVGMYYLAMWLHAHPSFLISMMSLLEPTTG